MCMDVSGICACAFICACVPVVLTNQGTQVFDQPTTPTHVHIIGGVGVHVWAHGHVHDECMWVFMLVRDVYVCTCIGIHGLININYRVRFTK